MELKKWIAQAFDEDQPVPVPDYDSTKANFNELENLISALQNDRDELADYTHERFVETIVDLNDGNDRLTALEGQPEAEYFEELFRTLFRRITALEAKDAPEKCSVCKGTGRKRHKHKDPESGHEYWCGVTTEDCPDCEGTGKQFPDTSKVDALERRINTLMGSIRDLESNGGTFTY